MRSPGGTPGRSWQSRGPPALALDSGYFSVSTGLTGAFSESTCRPTESFWPAAILVAQSDPLHVTDTLGITVHVVPHELATRVTFGSGQLTLQPRAARSPVTSMLAT